MRVLAVLLLAFVALTLAAPWFRAPAAAAAAASSVSYKPPVDGPIVDPYRPPPEPWASGNRGIDYAPGRGTPVKAAADGEVTFAGQVGGDLHVVVLHPDGVRTSYSFLDSIAVHRGDKVRQGQVVGTSGDDLHFGARVGDEYIDPRTLFDGPPQVFLVPDEVRKASSEAEERSGLSRFLSGVKKAVVAGGRAVGGQIVDKVDEARSLARAASRLQVWPHAVGLVSTVVDWWKQRSDCTPASVAPPPVPDDRVAVLVAGLGSTSDKGSVDDVDPKSLGYADDVRFSYKGGDAAQNPYGSRDTTVDLRTEAERLRGLLEQVHRDHPGKVVDVIAHSQGGLIARAALAHEYARDDTRLPPVANLVTLATPHQGAEMATILANVGRTPIGDAAEWALHNATWVDLRGASVRQLAEHSSFLADLDRRRLPEGVRFTSIGSRGDVVVPGTHTKAPGARNVLVDVAGLAADHAKLPGSPQGRREVALAVAGMPPTCQTLTDMLVDTVVSDAIATTEDAAGLGLHAASRWASGPVP